MNQGSVVARQASNHFQDLGSNPRSPTSSLFFLSGDCVYIQACSVPYTFTYPIARWPKAKSGGQELMVHHRQSQHMHAESGKVHQGQL